MPVRLQPLKYMPGIEVPAQVAVHLLEAVVGLAVSAKVAWLKLVGPTLVPFRLTLVRLAPVKSDEGRLPLPTIYRHSRSREEW